MLPDWSAGSSSDKELKPVAALKVPQGLVEAKKPSQYDIPPASNAPVSELELKSPMQVLALATNSRVEEEDKEARIWFERSEFTGDLLPFLKNSILKFGQDKQIEIKARDASGLIYETGWVTRTEETGWWFWTSTIDKEQSRFLLTLAPKPHGRSVSLRSQLLEHRYVNEPDVRISPIAKKREEVYFLNRVIDQIATLELAQIKQRKAREAEVKLTTGFDDNNNAVMLTSQSIDSTWSQLELLFEQSGWTVTDLNRTTYTYFLSYAKPEAGFWDSLWGDADTQVLPLQEGDYQLVLHKSKLGTQLSWRNKEGQALPATQVNQLHQALVPLIKKAGIEL